jgi:hypothetical protein
MINHIVIRHLQHTFVFISVAYWTYFLVHMTHQFSETEN